VTAAGGAPAPAEVPPPEPLPAEALDSHCHLEMIERPDTAGVLATADGGTVIFFSMATSFTAAALGAEGAAADVTMLIGNGYVPGHARLALDLVRCEPGVRGLFEARVTEGARDGKVEA